MAENTMTDWFDESVATFGDRLEAMREAAGMTPAELAQRLGVRDSTIEAWEADEWEPRGNRIQMLAGMLNVSLMWLMTGKGDGPDSPVQAKAAGSGAKRALAEIIRLRKEMQELNEKLAQAELALSREMQEIG